MSTLTWNEATGNLVSGHQRLAAIDVLEKKTQGDYYLTVSVCNLSDKEEKEQNIFFNSTTVQGEFDFDMLTDMLKDIDAFAAGFNQDDLNILGVAAFEQKITTDEQQEDKAFLKEQIKKAKRASADRIADRHQEGETYISLSFSTYDAKAAFCRKFGIPAGAVFFKGEEFERKVKG